MAGEENEIIIANLPNRKWILVNSAKPQVTLNDSDCFINLFSVSVQATALWLRLAK